MSYKIGDFISDDETPEEKRKRKLFLKKLRLILNQFTEKDQQIIKMRFGLNKEGGHTLEEVGLQYNVTGEYIRELESQIFKKMTK